MARAEMVGRNAARPMTTVSVVDFDSMVMILLLERSITRTIQHQR